MQRRGVLILSVLCALGWMGCDDSSDEDARTSCVSATFAPRCADTAQLIVCANGYEMTMHCGANATCADGKCLPTSACTEGEKKCSDDAGSLMTCTGGAWVPSVCAHGCDGGQCLVATDTCNTEGGRKCNADSTGTLVCQGGVWVPTDDLCHYGCTSGRCDEKVEELKVNE